MMWLFFSTPMTTLSSDSSISSCEISFLLRRAASRAASLSRFSRSAPVKPAVVFAMSEQLDIRVKLLVARMNLEDRLAALDIRRADIDLTVEAARTQQRVVQDILAVGRGDDDNALVRAEAVHLDEQLVERLLALVMTAAESCAALTADRVDLVDEHDGRRVLLGLLEQVAHARCADADIQLDEVRAGDRQERNACLACNRTRDQRFTGARRADQQHALGNARADLHEFLRIFQKLNDLLQLGLFLVRARDIVKRHLASCRPARALHAPCRTASDPRRRRTACSS